MAYNIGAGYSVRAYVYDVWSKEYRKYKLNEQSTEVNAVSFFFLNMTQACAFCAI